MRAHLSIRTKLFFSILLILLVSYSFLLYTSINSFESFLDREVGKDLDASLNLARNQFFARADQIRDELSAQGIELLDAKEGTSWKVK